MPRYLKSIACMATVRYIISEMVFGLSQFGSGHPFCQCGVLLRLTPHFTPANSVMTESGTLLPILLCVYIFTPSDISFQTRILVV
jgi:hypothetical protein